MIMPMMMDDYINLALKEDITSEDITTNAVISENEDGKVSLICKQSGVLAGLRVFEHVFKLLDERAFVESDYSDGDTISSGTVVGEVFAKVRALLTGERTALNYLQRMSGIATHTKELSSMLEGTGIRLLDTRKTTPNMRIFEKYAVRMGGGCNHRYNLSDGILIKDNHINAAGGITEAVKKVRAYMPFIKKIEIEVESLDMVREALETGADIIMLDNMDLATMKKAAEIIGDRAKIECSGNITSNVVSSLALIGIDYISCGALTHSSPILDFSIKNLQVVGD